MRNVGRPFFDMTGFTLLEVMAALAILGGAILIILQLFSGGLNLARKADEQTGIVLFAKEKMNELLLDNELREGEIKGAFEGSYKWVAFISPVKTDIEDPMIRSFKIELDVDDGIAKSSYRLSTLKTVLN
ncbi:MAG: prepilin-type N-terminal cleavage/methylation domain-containing protein [Deltaproteobacteria bacterium]|nr:prepilin-type N-terminal cleavage/methylation domain-containing protein [Deltaproteobacteria bacterium]